MKWRSEEVRIASLGAGVVAVAAASHEDRPRWFAVTHEGEVLGVELDEGAVFFRARLPFSVAHPGDALEERGGDARALAHLRAGVPHGRRCWVTESLNSLSPAGG